MPGRRSVRSSFPGSRAGVCRLRRRLPTSAPIWAYCNGMNGTARAREDVKRRWPTRSQIRTLPSAPPETTRSPSG